MFYQLRMLLAFAKISIVERAIIHRSLVPHRELAVSTKDTLATLYFLPETNKSFGSSILRGCGDSFRFAVNNARLVANETRVLSRYSAITYTST